MGKTFPNLDAERVDLAGYYFNRKLCKLARLQVGEKLPTHVGPWELIAGDRAMSSSQVVEKLRREHPELDLSRFTYTVRSPLDRRLPLGEPPRVLWLRYLAIACACVAAGWLLGQARMRA